MLRGISFLSVPLIYFALGHIKKEFKTIKYPEKFYDLTSSTVKQEKRPTYDVILHLLLFRFQVFGDGRFLQYILKHLNARFDHWDTFFADMGYSESDKVACLEEFCTDFGIDLTEWEFEKSLSDFQTMNDFFCRKYRPEISPEVLVKHTNHDICSPVTGTASFFESHMELPYFLKESKFTLYELPLYRRFRTRLSIIYYLAPADYHCFHSPVSGKVVRYEDTSSSRGHSVTVKNYIWDTKNILKRNKTVVVIIETLNLEQVCCVFIGGVTVDSIRMDPTLKQDMKVERGQYLGCFARGGSCAALFFDSNVTVSDDLVKHGMRIRMKAGTGLGDFNHPDQ